MSTRFDRTEVQEVLKKPIANRVDYFERKRIAHPTLLTVRDQLCTTIKLRAGVDLAIVTGPTGVGKSTLINIFRSQVEQDQIDYIRSDPGCVPAVVVEAPAPETSVFGWKDFWVLTPTRWSGPKCAFSTPPDSRKQVLALLKEEHTTADRDPEMLTYWQPRAGNEIANQFYQEGDFMKALDIYVRLAALDKSPEWQLPAWYQIGLIFERFNQPAKAIEYYGNITRWTKEVTTNAPPSLRAVLEMPNWARISSLGSLRQRPPT